MLLIVLFWTLSSGLWKDDDGSIIYIYMIQMSPGRRWKLSPLETIFESLGEVL